MEKDIYGVNNELETIRDVYLNTAKKNLFERLMNRESIRQRLRELSMLPFEDLKLKAIQNFYKIESGEVNIKEAERLETELMLVLLAIPPDKKNVNKYWLEKMSKIKKANSDMNPQRVLIEVAACHPLNDDKPNSEFESRLNKAIQIYKKEKAKGNLVTIYIPGSIHSISINGKTFTDSKSLSQAGKEYLISNGIPIKDIRADETNEKYKTNGVYNSGDECYVATRIAREEKSDRIISIVSPVQIYRKALFYIEFGYLPEIYTVSLEQLAHNYIGEAFFSLYVTYFKDHDWQEEFLAIKTRQERNIDFEVTDDYNELLENGINIPESIKYIKSLWLEKYNLAEQKRQANRENKNIMISYFPLENQQSITLDAIENIVQICHANAQSNIILCSRLDENEGIKLIQVLNNAGINNVEFINISDINMLFAEYGKSQCGQMYVVCQADASFARAFEYIENGVVPLIYAIPSINDDYINQIERLYNKLMQNYYESEISKSR